MTIKARHKVALGKKLHMARGLSNLSQREAARKVEISNAALSDIERGHNFPSEFLLLKLLKCYAPPDILCADIYQIYAEAKDALPPDISQFIKDNPCLHNFLRDLQKKEITPENIAEIRTNVQKWRDRE